MSQLPLLQAQALKKLFTEARGARENSELPRGRLAQPATAQQELFKSALIDLENKDPVIVKESIYCLGELGGENEAIQLCAHLTEALKSPDNPESENKIISLCSALSVINGPTAIDGLFAAAERMSPKTRHYAIWGLEHAITLNDPFPGMMETARWETFIPETKDEVSALLSARRRLQELSSVAKKAEWKEWERSLIGHLIEDTEESLRLWDKNHPAEPGGTPVQAL